MNSDLSHDMCLSTFKRPREVSGCEGARVMHHYAHCICMDEVAERSLVVAGLDSSTVPTATGNMFSLAALLSDS